MRFLLAMLLLLLVPSAPCAALDYSELCQAVVEATDANAETNAAYLDMHASYWVAKAAEDAYDQAETAFTARATVCGLSGQDIVELINQLAGEHTVLAQNRVTAGIIATAQGHSQKTTFDQDWAAFIAAYNLGYPAAPPPGPASWGGPGNETVGFIQYNLASVCVSSGETAMDTCGTAKHEFELATLAWNAATAALNSYIFQIRDPGDPIPVRF